MALLNITFHEPGNLENIISGFNKHPRKEKVASFPDPSQVSSASVLSAFCNTVAPLQASQSNLNTSAARNTAKVPLISVERLIKRVKPEGEAEV